MTRGWIWSDMLKRLLISLMSILLIVPSILAQQPRRKLDTTTFIVLGEGLSAGVCNFTLSSAGQHHSFPALMAQQMGALFPQPVIQPPGIANVMGFSKLPVRLPGALQTTVRRPFPPYLFVFNLSVPGLTTADAVTRRPVAPLIQAGDSKQTVLNFLLGFPQLIVEDDVPLWTQLEYARQMRPTFALVELGFAEALDAAVHGDLSRFPDLGAFRSNYEQIVTTLRSTYAEVLVTTVPDPLDTAYFNSPIGTAELTAVPPTWFSDSMVCGWKTGSRYRGWSRSGINSWNDAPGRCRPVRTSTRPRPTRFALRWRP